MDDTKKGPSANTSVSLPPEFWEHLVKNSHATATIMGAASLDDSLKGLIEAKFPNLSNTLREKLFEGYGALSSFSVRIDVAFAFGIISADIKSDLEALRQMRNAFAHSPESLSLKSPTPLKWLKCMRGYDGVRDPLVFLYEKLSEIREALFGPEVMKLARTLAAAPHLGPLPPPGSLEPSPPRSPPDPGGSGKDDREPPPPSPESEKKGLF